MKGKSIFQPDKEHFHHQLLKLGFETKKQAVCVNLCFERIYGSCSSLAPYLCSSLVCIYMTKLKSTQYFSARDLKQFKMAPVVSALKKKIQIKLLQKSWFTAQHREMLDQFPIFFFP